MPLFKRPFEVTQFWATDRYAVQQARYENLEAFLSVETDRQDQWFFSVSLPGTELRVGKYLDPFLPHCRNIAALNQAVCVLFGFMDTLHRTGRKVMPRHDPLRQIQRSPVPVSRDLGDNGYRQHLFDVLSSDWGIVLPLPSRIGKDELRLQYRPGMPCGPAMQKAVEPVLSSLWGQVRKHRVATAHQDGRTVDTVIFSVEGGSEREVAFDVTEYFGRNLDMTDFDLSSVTMADPLPSAPQPPPSRPKRWWKFWT